MPLAAIIFIVAGIDICHETVRFWSYRFGPLLAADIRCQLISRMKGFQHCCWHLDEMYVKINGEATICGGPSTTKGRCSRALSRRNVTNQRLCGSSRMRDDGMGPPRPSSPMDYDHTQQLCDPGIEDHREMRRWLHNRVESSHLPFRRRARAMQRFRRMKSLQKFASVHGNVQSHFNTEHHLIDRQTYKANRPVALAEWRSLMAKICRRAGRSISSGDEFALD